MAKQPESIVFKHQQHLKLQKEAEEESWISGEELRTDGSSDEEHQKNYKNQKKVKIRRKSGEKKEETPSTSKTEEPKDDQPGELEGAIGPVSWRPKRGSLKLPNLYEGFFDKERAEILANENFYDSENGFSSLPVIKSEEIENITNYNEKLVAIIDSIDQLQEEFAENMSQLEGEKRERLKIEEEICSEICNDKEFSDKNDALFLKLCRCERSSENENGDFLEAEEKIRNKRPLNEPHGKNFIRRNIELAAKAMSNLPLTDEEKKQLEQILADIDTQDRQNEKEENSETINLENNAFHLSETDQQRLGEIDSKLQNEFTETQNLRACDNNEENFWRSLILNQRLNDIDEKLAALKREDSKDVISQN